ncbi:MAG: hypothetical protein N4A31_00810 [Rickettsiales bacterium]|jgi:hypothetical protein|nr:hypothetical protein [Rickettsiales bacterium]
MKGTEATKKEEFENACKGYRSNLQKIEFALEEQARLQKMSTSLMQQKLLQEKKEELVTAREELVTKKQNAINAAIKLAKFLGYKSQNSRLDSSKELTDGMRNFIIDKKINLDSKALLFITNFHKEKEKTLTEQIPKTAAISLADPAKLSNEKITEINNFLEENNIYKAAQLMQGKEIYRGEEISQYPAIADQKIKALKDSKDPKDEEKIDLMVKEARGPNEKDLKEANKVLREYQKAIDKVAPPIKIIGKKHDQHDNLRNMAKNIGKTLGKDSLRSRAAQKAKSMASKMRERKTRAVQKAKSMASKMREKLSSIQSTAVSTVRGQKRKVDKGMRR